MLPHQTLKDLSSAISSPESADGHTLCASLVCQTLSIAGPEAHLVSHSAQPENNSLKTTPDTSRRLSPGSSLSIALQSCLESKLERRLTNSGSMIYSLSWKKKTTPAQRQFCLLQSTARTTKESEFASVRPWATVTARAGKDTGNLSKSFYRKDGRMRNDTLYRQMWLHTFGLNGDPTREQMAKLECYLPVMARLLMGYPQGWSDCAVLVTQ